MKIPSLADEGIFIRVMKTPSMADEGIFVNFAMDIVMNYRSSTTHFSTVLVSDEKFTPIRYSLRLSV